VSGHAPGSVIERRGTYTWIVRNNVRDMCLATANSRRWSRVLAGMTTTPQESVPSETPTPAPRAPDNTDPLDPRVPEPEAVDEPKSPEFEPPAG
jgi:hypothetical protein